MVTENIYIKINMDILWSNIYIEVSKEIICEKLSWLNF